MGDRETDHDLLIRIDERQEVMIEKIGNVDERLKDQNGRIDKLENWRWWLGGGIVTGVAVIRFWPG